MNDDRQESQKARSLVALADAYANEGILKKQRLAISEVELKLVRLKSRQWWFIGGLVAFALSVVVPTLLWSHAKLSEVDAATNNAAALVERANNGLNAVKTRTYGARFFETKDGWFINFPKRTILKKLDGLALPTVQVLPK